VPPRGQGIVRRGFRVIWMAIRRQPKPFAVAVAGAALYGGMTVASAVVFGRVTDLVIVPAFREGDTTRGALALAVAAIVGVAVLKAIGIVTRRVGATYMQFRLHAIYRREVTHQYQRLPLSWHRRHTTGELLSNANADVEAAFWPIAPLPFSIGVAFMLVITLGLLLTTDLFLTGVGLLIGPAVAIVNWRYNRLTEGPATRAQQRRADVSEVAHESFDGALVVKTLGREAAETERFQVESERLRDELVHLGRIRAVFDPVMEALPQAGILLVVIVGAWRIDAGMMTAGDLVQVAYLFTLLAFPLRVIGFLLGDLPRAVVGWERVERVLRADESLRYGDQEIGGSGGPAAADLVAVSFRYPDEDGDGRGLEDITFEAEPGRTIAIVGPTGAGKSTIASLLVRLADPGEGTVRLDGHDLRSLRPGSVSSSAAIVFQHSFLFDDSVRDNIALGDDFTDEQIEQAARLAQAHEFIRALPDGYGTVVGERGTSLSGGQRQRIALARALVRQPRLLILDDATSSVDPTVEAAILTGLKEAALPSTIVVVAYRQATISLADEIVFLHRGTIRAQGRHEDLLASVPAYARLVTAYDVPPPAHGEVGLR
jgi:ATP-binding cassette, subfamily B, bacterial